VLSLGSCESLQADCSFSVSSPLFSAFLAFSCMNLPPCCVRSSGLLPSFVLIAAREREYRFKLFVNGLLRVAASRMASFFDGCGR
jgi:hypothetical protein